MKGFSRLFLVLLVLSVAGQLNAATVTVNFNGIIDSVTSITGINAGNTFNGSFTYDLNPANAAFIDSTTIPGFTDYGFTGPAYGADASAGSAAYVFPDVEFIVADNFIMLADEFFPGSPAGTFDMVILGGSPSDFESTLSGMTSLLVMVGEQTLFTGDGLFDVNTLITDPDYIGAGFLLLEFGGSEIPIGEAFGLATIAPVPVPSAVWLFGSGLLGIFGFMRRKS